MRLLLIPLFLTSFTSSVFAADYSWHHQFGGSGYSSSSSACQSIVSILSTPDATQTYTYSSSTSTLCIITTQNIGDVDGITIQNRQYPLTRLGDSCPNGSTYNSSGSCDLPINPCTSQKDQLKTWIVKYTQEQYAKAVGKGGQTPSQWVDSGGCQAEVTTKECGAAGDGSGACFGVAKLTGLQTPADAIGQHTDCTGTPDCPAAKVEFDASNDHSCSAITYTGNGASQYECVTEAVAENPGAVKCGQVTTGGSSQWVCTAPKPTPSSEKSKVTETVKTTPNPDGSKTKETTKVTETTKCKDGKCQTTTTTNVIKEGTNADGTEKPKEESCTGPKCATDETKEELEEEEGDSSASGIACSESLACEGDAISCALLRTQKESKCDAEEAGDYPGKKGDIDTLLSGAQFSEPSESEISLAGIFNTGTRFLPSACPADMPIQIGTFNRTITLKWSPLCTLAETLSYLIVAMASLFFVRYVGEGQ